MKHNIDLQKIKLHELDLLCKNDSNEDKHEVLTEILKNDEVFNRLISRLGDLQYFIKIFGKDSQSENEIYTKSFESGKIKSLLQTCYEFFQLHKLFVSKQETANARSYELFAELEKSNAFDHIKEVKDHFLPDLLYTFSNRQNQILAWAEKNNFIKPGDDHAKLIENAKKYDLLMQNDQERQKLKERAQKNNLILYGISRGSPAILMSPDGRLIPASYCGNPQFLLFSTQPSLIDNSLGENKRPGPRKLV